MFLNYLKIFAHNLSNNKSYAFINIVGLGLGLCCFILIGLYVQHELSYESQFARADRIYRLSREFKATETSIETHLATMAAPAGEFMKQDFPQVEQATRLTIPQEVVFGTEDGTLATEPAFSYADANVVDFFDFDWLAGDPQSALRDPNSVVLTASAARRYFGDSAPLGQTLLMNNRQAMKVTGVIRDLGDRTHLAFGMLASMATFAAATGPDFFRNWDRNLFHTYLLLKPGTDVDWLRAQSDAFFERHWQEGGSRITRYDLTALKDIHLSPGKEAEMSPSGSATVVNLFALVALFILCIACINFMNLTASRLIQRGNEIGMRKVVGASRATLVLQLLFESVALSVLALLLGVVAAELLLPWFGNLLGMHLQLDAGKPLFLLLLPVLALVTGTLAGLYPALYLSGFGASGMLKGLTALGRGLWFRKALVVLQFAISIALMIAMSVVYLQMRYVRNLDLGYDKDHMVILSGSGAEGLGTQWESMKRELLANPQISAVTASDIVPSTANPNAIGVSTEGGVNDRNQGVTNMWVDYGFFETYGIQLIAGRAFSPAFPTDRMAAPTQDGSQSVAYVINASLARKFGWEPEQAVGKNLTITGGNRGPVIGVVKDVLLESVRSPIKPLIYIMPPDASVTGFSYLREASVRISGSDMQQTLAYIDAVWHRFLPNQPVNRRFLDEDFSALYAAEKLEGQIFTLFSLLAIFIACLGLYGLAALNAERRTKEIGVRKVLGGSVWNIVLLLTNDFSRLVLAANVIAWPVAYFAMNNWLKNFSYRVDLTPLVFIGSGVIAFLIAWVTVGGTAAKAASRKPVLALRYE